jgi:hypothetical protein
MGKELLTFKNAVILIVIIMLVAILRTAIDSGVTITSLEREANVVFSALSGEVVDSDVLIEAKLENLNDRGYESIKKVLGVESDFCIYFEDITGNVVQIDGIDPGIGSNNIYINDKPCR